MTYHISRDFAYDVGLAHEGLKRDYNFNKQDDDVKMDISNNYSGRKIGSATKTKKNVDSAIAKTVMNNVCSGKLKRIRTYTSKKKGKKIRKIAGVNTIWTGYYVKTTNGGKKTK